MKLSKLFTTSLIALCLSFPIAACDGDDDGDTTDTNATNNGDTTEDGATEETGPSNDTTCAVFCVAYLQLCVESGMSTEFPNNDACDAACEMWDQDGKNCRYEQISVVPPVCDQAGNTGDAC
jgi:hypothetical protein